MIQNATDGHWDGPGLAQAAGRSARARDQLLDQIVNFVAANKLQGITIDFEDVPHDAHKNLEDFPLATVASFRAA